MGFHQSELLRQQLHFWMLLAASSTCALPIWSKRLGLTGKSDLVEFRSGVTYPVEYKSGKKRKGRHEELQLCAQAVCLEEMFGVTVAWGALYWHGSRKRQEVEITEELRVRLELTVPVGATCLSGGSCAQRFRYVLSCWTYRLTRTNPWPARKQAVARTLRVIRKE